MNIFQIAVGIFKDLVSIARKYYVGRWEVPTEWSVGKKHEIILLPGFTENWAFIDKMGDELNKLGYKLLYINSLGNNTEPVEVEREKVKNFIIENHKDDIIFLAHSKGGVIGKLLLDDNEVGKNIKALITISTPYHGTLFGHAKVLSLNKLTPGSAIISGLHTTNKNNLKIYNLYPEIDTLVIPNNSLVLNGANNIKIDAIGHANVMDDKKTLSQVITILKHLEK